MVAILSLENSRSRNPYAHRFMVLIFLFGSPAGAYAGLLRVVEITQARDCRYFEAVTQLRGKSKSRAQMSSSNHLSRSPEATIRCTPRVL